MGRVLADPGGLDGLLPDTPEGARMARETAQMFAQLRANLANADHETAARVELEAYRRGLLMLTCGDDAIRMSPALVFREDQARVALEIFEEVVAAVEAEA